MTRTKRFDYTCVACGLQGRSRFRSAVICEPCAREAIPEYLTLPHHAFSKAEPNGEASNPEAVSCLETRDKEKASH